MNMNYNLSTGASRSKSPHSFRSLSPISMNLLSPSTQTNSKLSITPHKCLGRAKKFPKIKSRVSYNVDHMRKNFIESSDSETLRKKTIKSKLNDLNKYSEVINALFVMAHRYHGKISALNISQIFISMRYTSNATNLIQMFKDISDCKDFNVIAFSRDEILDLCIDSRVETILEALILECIHKNKNSTAVTYEELLKTIKQWWNKLNEKNRQQCTTEDCARFLLEHGALDNNSIGRILSKFSGVVSCRQFCSIFSKSLFKFLILQLVGVTERKTIQVISPDIAISAYKRKNLIDSLKVHDHMLEALAACDNYKFD
ncbi:hypothetical protein SteCoe_29777 [Stentor coeruleus]|uniref:Uncharacterized protein n=1 Tax=Stentor coeruleus TaxID=5963 RepID=A0A1R2B528_9CILI|nr:hypothetical protein SteCoe_29777 [Stentor coeruleus]